MRDVQTMGAFVNRPYNMLVVCTGNICRSPAGERLFAVAADRSIVVSSAGTAAMVGYPISPLMADRLVGLGVPVDGFAARQLTPDLIRQADLVLTMEKQQRRWVVDRVPEAVRKVFTLRELAHVADVVGPLSPGLTTAQRLTSLAEVVPQLRLRADVARKITHHLTVQDPYGRDDGTYDKALGQIGDAVYRILGVDPTGWLPQPSS
jgi:protein-tyrosine phosphatase